MSHGR
jgi:hypothetical protein